MAFLREYDFREKEDVLVEYFFVDAKVGRPSMVLRVNVTTKEITVKPVPWLSTLYIREEIIRLYNLLEEPHWKSFVRTCSVEHRYRNYELF